MKSKDKVLNLPPKKLMWSEAMYIYYNRNSMTFNEDEALDKLLEFEFIETKCPEFDVICKDLRSYRRLENYTLKNISIEEYNMCVEYFNT